jgi:hypothetical protein
MPTDADDAALFLTWRAQHAAWLALRSIPQWQSNPDLKTVTAKIDDQQLKKLCDLTFSRGRLEVKPIAFYAVNDQPSTVGYPDGTSEETLWPGDTPALYYSWFQTDPALRFLDNDALTNIDLDGIGREVMAWVSSTLHHRRFQQPVSLLRLDAVSKNPRLLRYYEDNGFSRVRDDPTLGMTFFQRNAGFWASIDPRIHRELVTPMSYSELTDYAKHVLAYDSRSPLRAFTPPRQLALFAAPERLDRTAFQNIVQAALALYVLPPGGNLDARAVHLDKEFEVEDPSGRIVVERDDVKHAFANWFKAADADLAAELRRPEQRGLGTFLRAAMRCERLINANDASSTAVDGLESPLLLHDLLSRLLDVKLNVGDALDAVRRLDDPQVGARLRHSASRQRALPGTVLGASISAPGLELQSRPLRKIPTQRLVVTTDFTSTTQPVESSHRLDEVDERVTTAVIVVHGMFRNVFDRIVDGKHYPGYADIGRMLTRNTNGRVAFIAPNFLADVDATHSANLRATDNLWTRETWKTGEDAIGREVSSFDVLDACCRQAQKMFPNVDAVKVASYSAGTKLAQLYFCVGKALSELQRDGVDVQLFGGAPSLAMYFNSERLVDPLLVVHALGRLMTQAEVDQIRQWPYEYCAGAEDRPRYARTISPEIAAQNYLARDKVFIVGREDDRLNIGLQTEPAALLHGIKGRLQRVELGIEHLTRVAGKMQLDRWLHEGAESSEVSVNARLLPVAGIGHEAHRIFRSPEVRQALFAGTELDAPPLVLGQG